MSENRPVTHQKLIKKLVWREWLEAILVALLVAGALRVFVVEPLRIPTASMVPALEPGDFVLAWKSAYGLRLPFGMEPFAARSPRRGDVVVFRHPQDDSLSLIKRVVGLEGDRIAIRDGLLSINEQVVTAAGGAEIIGDTTHWVRSRSGRDEADFFGPVVVPPGHVFVLGDNRGESEDSRFWGAVPLRQIEGRAFVVWFSVQHGPGAERSIRWERILSPIP
ncbi:MAG: signal peptidase I [Bdellovibrionaceae bacterium]|nr:signal peptidase I [Pseudobdellovibrionaceae bacterium]